MDMFNAYQEASARMLATEERYLAAKQAAAIAAQENEQAAQDLSERVRDLFETRPACASSAKALLGFIVDAPYLFQDWVHSGGDAVNLIGWINEALTHIEPMLRIAA